jgi:ATP-binding cassette subfamily C protein/ATP-binding cassette subfamily C exporter for protease/lipase/ATP-binding cassette subfamily C protein EexD
MQVVDDEEVVKAATLACAHEMIQHFPQGYDTWIGDGGVRLSGGQRQRVGFARAVFGSPRFIVLDEPNANLDQAGEAALSDAISELKQAGVALVIVGHRPSTLSAVDKILLLKEGRVAMFGERDDVLSALKEASEGSLAQTSNREARQRITALEARQRINALKERLAGSLPQTGSREARQLISAGNGSHHNGKLTVGVP